MRVIVAVDKTAIKMKWWTNEDHTLAVAPSNSLSGLQNITRILFSHFYKVVNIDASEGRLEISCQWPRDADEKK